MEKDCKVCQKLIKEKHKYDFLWKVACVIFFILAVVFAVLYFGSGAMVTETTIEITDNQIQDGSDMGGVMIGNEDSTISGNIETKDNTGLMIFLGIICGSGIIVVGGCIIAYYNKEKNNNNNKE